MTTNPETITLRDHRRVLVRHVQAGDGASIHRYLHDLGASTNFILTFPGDLRSVEAYEAHTAQCESGHRYAICAIDASGGSSGSSGPSGAGGTIVAMSSYTFYERVKLAHVAGLGTGVLPEWQGVGLGSWMLERSIADMRARPGIHRLELTVIAGNEHAQRMYSRAGFVVEGRKSRSVRQPDGSYSDEILMALWIGDGSEDAKNA